MAPHVISKAEFERLHAELDRFLETNPIMPVAVSDMTANEYVLFEQLARASGIMLYLRGRVAETLNLMSGVESEPPPQ